MNSARGHFAGHNVTFQDLKGGLGEVGNRESVSLPKGGGSPDGGVAGALALDTSATPASRCSRCGSQSVTVTVTQATRRDEPAAFKLDYDHWQPLQ